MARASGAVAASLIIGLGASSSRAQGDWNGFAPPPPPPPLTSSAKSADAPQAAALPPPPALPVAAEPGTAVAPVREGFVPGSEPHSPGTWDHAFSAPGNLRLRSGIAGGIGLLRVGSASIGPAGIFRISLNGEYFSSSDFPVVGAQDTRTAGTLAVDYTLLPFLEAWASYSSAANTNSRSTPKLIQAQGDLRLGLRAAFAAFDGFEIGADVTGTAMPGIGAQDASEFAFAVAPRLLVTVDARKYSSSVPLRLHLNAGAVFDQSGDLVESGHSTGVVDEFALGLHKYDRYAFGGGLELPMPWVTPFVEYNVAIPRTSDALVGPDGLPVTLADAMPQTLGVGLQITAVRDLSITLACEIGLARRVALGVPATAPYNAMVGLTYAFDPAGRATTRIVEKTVEVERKVEVAAAAAPTTGKVSGAVLDAETRKPIPGAVVEIAGAGVPPVASARGDGEFLTHELPPGPVTLSVARDGYKPATLPATVELGKVTPVQVLLAREAKGGKVSVSLTAGKKKTAGKVAFTGPRNVELGVAPEGGSIELPAGHYTAAVEAEGCLSRVQELDVPEGGIATLALELGLKPKVSLVVVKDDHIEIKQQVHFAPTKATILADSYSLLDQVIDAVVRSGIKKVRVEGHTDNVGFRQGNLKLSQARAQAVADYLVKRGIAPSRIVAEGFGDSRPLAPNLTARGRELNRRVEFVIVER